MPGVFHLTNILELVIYGFNNRVKHLVASDLLVMANPKHCGVYETDTGTFASAAVMQKQHKGDCMIPHWESNPVNANTHN